MQKKDCNQLGITFKGIANVCDMLANDFEGFFILKIKEEKNMLEKIFKRKVKKQGNEAEKIYAPVTGEYIPLSDIPDDVFASGMLGDGCGVIPYTNEVVAPVDGHVEMIADTKHAIAIRSEKGVDVLIHIGLDTVELNGEGFEVKVQKGEHVQKGQLLMNIDLDGIKANAKSEVSAVVIMNSSDYKEICIEVPQNHKTSEVLGTVV